MKWLPYEDMYAVLSISKEWNSLAKVDYIWRDYFAYKFLRSNPESAPNIQRGYMEAFRLRFHEPQVGDSVEVSWHGKFRLESNDEYFGLAWWAAVIVDKHALQGKYKIHYPGWDVRWDEWVVRSRLRWFAERNVVESVKVNDPVEIWCCGAQVPGAWLEAKITKVVGNRYCVGRVHPGAEMWVDRDRLRLVKRVKSSAESQSRRRLFRRDRGLVARVREGMAAVTTQANCAVM